MQWSTPIIRSISIASGTSAAPAVGSYSVLVATPSEAPAVSISIFVACHFRVY